jgi:crotonobetainyl-CoA:carnitine CoA-transferase CaiB-like acyl-CoA transferase
MVKRTEWESLMPGPLDGVRVVDLTNMVSGPVATRMLADQGADVIKVEKLVGEEVRKIGPEKNGITSTFFSCNRGKRSLALDLKVEEGRAVLRDLVATADVFVQNFRPGAIERMGFSEKDVRAIKPDIIYTSISGFGETGPYAHKRVYDPVIQALCGATDVQADRETRKPQMFRVIIADKVTAVTAAQAITAALFARERTKVGQHIKLAMVDAMISFFWPENFATLTFVGEEVDPSTFQTGMDLIYETKDGYITAGAISDDEWQGMCRALNREEWIEDTRFRDTRARFKNVNERKKLTADEIAKWASDEILARLDNESVPSAPILKRADLFKNAQIIENNVIDVSDYDGIGKVRQARPAANFDQTPASIAGGAPRLGEHTTQILDSLGYPTEKVRTLAQKNVIGAV